VAAVAQDGDVVAQAEQFLHAVRDVDDGDAAFLQFAKEMEQVLAFPTLERELVGSSRR